MTLPLDPSFDLSPAWAVLPWLAGALVVLVWAGRRAGSAVPRARHRALGLLRAGVLTVLAVIALDPVRVSVTPAPAHRPEVHILLDASQSMRLGTPTSRWEEATGLLREALRLQDWHADVRVYRFGERLAPIDIAAFVPGGPGTELAPPTDADTHLAAALRQLAGRIGRDPPAALVVVSDGRVRDPDKMNEMTSTWQRLRVPIHVVPVGKPAEGGDVAIVAAVAPTRARKQTQVTVNVFLRSFGFSERRVELRLQALAENGTVRRTLTTLPVTLRDGVQPLTVAFRMEPDLKRLRLQVTPPVGDLSAANNDFPFEIELDRTKIRVLLLEGSDAPGLARPGGQRFGEGDDDPDAPYAPFRDALLADPDIQCTVYHVSAGGKPQRVLTRETAHLGPAFLKTAA